MISLDQKPGIQQDTSLFYSEVGRYNIQINRKRDLMT